MYSLIKKLALKRKTVVKLLCLCCENPFPGEPQTLGWSINNLPNQKVNVRTGIVHRCAHTSKRAMPLCSVLLFLWYFTLYIQSLHICARHPGFQKPTNKGKNPAPTSWIQLPFIMLLTWKRITVVHCSPGSNPDILCIKGQKVLFHPAVIHSNEKFKWMKVPDFSQSGYLLILEKGKVESCSHLSHKWFSI